MAASSDTYHVRTDGSNANDGLSSGNAFRSPKAAVAVAASGSEVLLYFDPATTSEFLEGTELTINNSLYFIGVDSAGVRADDWLTTGADTLWNKEEQPTILWTGSYTGRAVEPQSGDRITSYGVIYHGSGSALSMMTNSATSGQIKTYDSTFRGTNSVSNAFIPLQITNADDQAHRCLVIGGEHNINVGTYATASFCILSGAADDPVYTNSGGVLAYMENILIIHGNTDGGTLDDVFQPGGAGIVVKNMLIVDNQTQHAIDLVSVPNATYTNAHTTNFGSFHTVGPYDGSPAATNYSTDPLFVDFAAGDYRLQSSSPILALGTSADIQGTLTYDLQAVGMSYPIGPYKGAPVTSPWLFDEGSGSSTPITPDFTINTVLSQKGDYNRMLDAIPFGLATPGPISLRNRKIPYKVTR